MSRPSGSPSTSGWPCSSAPGIWLTSGPSAAGQFYAGWLTEYSLSVDNLFVFVIIMARFAVPRQYQQKVLLIGIVLALVMRGGFIAAGAALITQFVWVFYIFGAFLIYTAVNLARQGETGRGRVQGERADPVEPQGAADLPGLRRRAS